MGQALELRNRGFKPKTNDGDKGHHTAEFVAGMCELGIVPHPALKAGQNTLRVVCTAAHAASQKLRQRIEEIFGRTKTTGCFRKSRYRGVGRTRAQGQYATSFSIRRLPNCRISGSPTVL